MQHFLIRTSLLALAVIVAGLPSHSHAESSTAPTRRPRIGLVLEGGGALGFAHVGVIKVMEENHVPVDMVAGTSMGSIVAAAYASGQTVEVMEHTLAITDWDQLFSENPPRQDIPFRYKPGRNREIFGSAKVGIGDNGMVMPVGMIQGQNVLPLLQRLFGNVPSPVDFDKLPIPFRAVSADIETGESVVFTKGDLATVVRASMSVPGVFSPVEIDGHMLVDGGITDNLPVTLTRSLGADVLIVIALDSDPVKVSELTSPFAISGRVIDMLLSQNSEQSVKLLRPEDLLIRINLGKLGAGDFASAKEIMAIGEARAREVVNEIRRFSVSDEEFEKYSAKRTGEKIEPVTIDFIKVENDSRTPEEILRAEFGVKEGDKFDRDVIEKGLQRIYNSGWYTYVQYAMATEEDKNGIVLNVKRRKWFDNYLRVGLALEDDFQGSGEYRFGLNWRTTSLNDYGAYADFIGEIGKSPYISGEWYQPLDVASPYFIAPSAEYGLSQIDVSKDGDAVAEYDRIIGSGTLRIGREIGTIGETAIGYTRGEGQLRREVGDPALPDLDYEIGDFYAGLILDGLDTPDFPTDGYLLRFAYRTAQEDLGSSSEFEDYTASTTIPFTFGRTTLLIGGEMGLTPDNRPIERSYSLGGFLGVSGFEPNSLLASDFWSARVAAYHRFSELKIPLFGFGFFVGSSAEFTSLRSDMDEIPDDPSIVSGSVFVGADTPLIPAYLSFGINDESSHAVTLNLGRIGSFRR